MAKKVAVKKAAPKKAEVKKAAPKKAEVKKAAKEKKENPLIQFPTNIFGLHHKEHMERLSKHTEERLKHLNK